MEQTSRRRSLQFSIREMLILILAIAAILALFIKNRPYLPTPFLTSLDEKTILNEISADLGKPLDIRGINSRGTTGSGFNSSWSSGELELSITLRETDIKIFQSRVMPKLQKRIGKLIVDSGGSIGNRSQAGNKDLEELRQFGFQYRIKKTKGKIRVYSIEQPNGQLRLMIIVDEW